MTTSRSQGPGLQAADLLHGDVRLASPPEIYARLRRLLDDPDTTLSELANTIGRDPALTARLLQLANSAFFALQAPVYSISEAVSRIGLGRLQNLVLATEVIRHFEGIPEDLVDIYAFWRGSLRCAALARAIGGQRKKPGDLELLFLGGLLHGVGHLVLYSRLPELSRKALLEHRHRRLPLPQVERETFGFDYSAVSAELARQWDLPAPIRAILAHHLAPVEASDHRGEVAVVHLAVVAGRVGSFEPEKVTGTFSRDSRVWELAGLSPAAAEGALPEAEQAFNDALALLH